MVAQPITAAELVEKCQKERVIDLQAHLLINLYRFLLRAWSLTAFHCYGHRLTTHLPLASEPSPLCNHTPNPPFTFPAVSGFVYFPPHHPHVTTHTKIFYHACNIYLSTQKSSKVLFITFFLLIFVLEVTGNSLILHPNSFRHRVSSLILAAAKLKT